MPKKTPIKKIESVILREKGVVDDLANQYPFNTHYTEMKRRVDKALQVIRGEW